MSLVSASLGAEGVMDLRSHLSKLVATNARNELFLWFGRCEMTLLLLDTQQFEPILLSQFTEGLFEEYSCFTEHVFALENSRELSKIFNAHALNTPSLRIQQVDKSAEQDLLLGEGEEMFTLTFVYKQVTVEHQIKMVEKECFFDLKNYPAKLTASKHIVFKSLTNTLEIFSDIRSPFLRLKLLPEELKITTESFSEGCVYSFPKSRFKLYDHHTSKWVMGKRTTLVMKARQFASFIYACTRGGISEISLYLNLRVENSLLTIYFVGTGPNKVCLTAIVAEVDELDVEETGQINTLERWFGNEQKAVAVPALVSIPFEEDLEDLPMKRRPQTIGAMVENEEMEESEGEIYLGKRGG